MQNRFIILISGIILMVFVSAIYADTILLKDGRKIEGFILEEQSDCYVVKITIGTMTIDKGNVSEVKRLSPEENYLNLGAQYLLARNYDAALEQYKKALEINPAFQPAIDAIVKIEKIKSETEEKKLAELKQKEEGLLEKKTKALRAFGMELEITDGQLRASKIEGDVQADVAGIRPSDVITQIDGQITKGKSLEEILNYLLKPDRTLFKFTIQRNLNLTRKRIEYQKRPVVGIGIFLDIDEDGLVISDVIAGQPAASAGLKMNDRPIAIDDVPTKAMSLDEASVLIGGDESTNVKLTIQRSVELERR